MPTALYWNPLQGNHLASAAANWHIGSADGTVAVAAPTASDDLFFVEIPVYALDPDADGQPSPGTGGPGGTSPPATPDGSDCTIDIASGLDFNGIHLMEGYKGTVDFRASALVGVLELHDGHVVQNDEYFTTVSGGNELSVSQSMVWTGGDFNDGGSTAGLSAEYAKLTLQSGSVSVFDPGDGKTLKLGSYLTVSGAGSRLDLPSGTIAFKDQFVGVLGTGASIIQGRIVPNQQSQSVFSSPGGVPLAKAEGKFNTITLSKGAEFHIKRKDPSAVGAVNTSLGAGVSLLIDGGAFQVYQDVSVRVSGQLSDAKDAPSIRVSDNMQGGIRIGNGSTLKASNGIVMDGGSIVTLVKYDSKGVAVQPQGRATIVGDVTINRGWIKQNFNQGGGWAVGEDPGSTDFANTHAILNIVGNFDWQQGGYVGWVNPQTQVGDFLGVSNHPDWSPAPVTCKIAAAVQFDIGYYPSGGAIVAMPAGTKIELVKYTNWDNGLGKYVEGVIAGLPTLIGNFVNDAKLSVSMDGGTIYIEKK